MQQNVHGSLAACKTTFKHDDVDMFKDFITQEEFQGVFQDVFFFSTTSHPPHCAGVLSQGWARASGGRVCRARSHPPAAAGPGAQPREARRPSLPQAHRRHFHRPGGKPAPGAARHSTAQCGAQPAAAGSDRF